MIVGLLGLLDLHVAILLCAVGLKVEVPLIMIFATAALLFAKACICITDVGGLQDIGTTILILLSIFINIPPVVLFAAAAASGIKGLVSLAP